MTPFLQKGNDVPYKDTSFIGLGPYPMTSLNPNCFLKGPISKVSQWGLELQHGNGGWRGGTSPFMTHVSGQSQVKAPSCQEAGEKGSRTVIMLPPLMSH